VNTVDKKIIFYIRNRFLLAFDCLLIAFAFLLSVMLACSSDTAFSYYFANFVKIIPVFVSYVGCMYLGKVYTTMWVYAGARDYFRVALTLGAASVISVCASVFYTPGWAKISIVSIILADAFILLLRMAVRGLSKLYKYRIEYDSEGKRILIIGAGNASMILLREQITNKDMNYRIVGLIDDDKNKKNFIMHGCRVLGDTADIPYIAEKYEIDEIIFAIPSASAKRKSEILSICSETTCKIKTLPGINEIVNNEIGLGSVRSVTINDLLSRDPISLDNKEISEYISGRTVFVTGGGGSIGSELCRQIMKFNPGKLVIIDIYENNAYDLQMELNREYPDNKPDVLIASVRDTERLDEIFEEYKPYIVFHAAAHKHVPLMEDSPGEAIKNNVFGTYNVAKCADKYGVYRFVMISTDKAVNPTNVMGATKRLCEMIIQTFQKKSKTEYVAVRFGNVLGSNGSVVPLFKRQIEQGGPVTVTHKEITRFFMTIPEAAQLVLQAASYASGGEIFVLDMGEPVKIYDLAEKMIRLYGYKPGIDIKIEVTGLRPGEKLYEELLMNEEGLMKTKNDKIFVGEPVFGDESLLETNLSSLNDAVNKKDNELIKSVLERVVPTYKRTDNKQAEPVA